MHITTTNNLLTESWRTDVRTIEAAVGNFKASRLPANDCRVAFFEIGDDTHLHVNVTHRHQTRGVGGWIGPAQMPAGFVHNRLFGNVPAQQIVRDIREMVFARRM